ncbi:NIMA (never in mitosis [Striga asiatica]|uniref:NIMA (never in mitosis) n=1 Tax=Striga asiatica TaxID=4170 RepID=A0A5A7NY98_STRAF|nr:NIMA (never in mitosis [Striga asiatica]
MEDGEEKEKRKVQEGQCQPRSGPNCRQNQRHTDSHGFRRPVPKPQVREGEAGGTARPGSWQRRNPITGDFPTTCREVVAARENRSPSRSPRHREHPSAIPSSRRLLAAKSPPLQLNDLCHPRIRPSRASPETPPPHAWPQPSPNRRRSLATSTYQALTSVTDEQTRPFFPDELQRAVVVRGHR